MSFLRVNIDGTPVETELVNGNRTSLKDLRLALSNKISDSHFFKLNGETTIPRENETKLITDLGITQNDNTLHIVKEPEFILPKNSTSLTFKFTSETTPPWLKTKPSTVESHLIITSNSKPTDSKTQNDASITVQQGKDNETQTLCQALNSLMISNGFKEHNPLVTQATHVTTSINHYCYTAPIGPMVTVDMVCTSLGPQIITHATNDSSNEVMTCVLSKEHYLSKDLSTAKVDIRNVKELHQQFIDAIPHRLLTNIRRTYEMPETGTLIGLLHEIKLTIMCWLDIRSLMNMTLVCREFYLLSQDSYLWTRLFMRDFGNGMLEKPQNDGSDNFWKKLYQHEMKRQAKISKPKQPIHPDYYHETLFDPWWVGSPLTHPSIFSRGLRYHGHNKRRFNPYSMRSPLVDPSTLFDPLSNDSTLLVPPPFEFDLLYH